MENALNVSIFTQASVSYSKFPAEFFKNVFLRTAESGGENYDLLYQNSIRKYGTSDNLYFA